MTPEGIGVSWLHSTLGWAIVRTAVESCYRCRTRRDLQAQGLLFNLHYSPSYSSLSMIRSMIWSSSKSCIQILCSDCSLLVRSLSMFAHVNARVPDSATFLFSFAVCRSHDGAIRVLMNMNRGGGKIDFWPTGVTWFVFRVSQMILLFLLCARRTMCVKTRRANNWKLQ